MTNRNSEIINSSSSIFIATFSHYSKGERQAKNGMVNPLISFFSPKVREIILLDEPHVISDTIDPVVERFYRRKLKERFVISSLFYLPIYLLCKIKTTSKTRVSYKLRDFYSIFLLATIYRKKYDLFIGLESINTLGGIILKKLGIVKSVVYYVSDYSPTRFGDTFFNKVYIWLDKFCVRNADFTWDVSTAMREGRKLTGLTDLDMNRVLHVPNGLFPFQMKIKDVKDRKINSLVYVGTLDEEFGVELAVRSFVVVRKTFPNSLLNIIGTGANEESLKRLVKRLNLESSVFFHGYIKSDEEVANIVSECYVGLAPYRSFRESFRWFADAGKIRQYLASGLPVISTNVPPLGRAIVKKGAGILVNDNIDDFSRGIIRVLKDKKLYKTLSAKAEKISKNNTWNNVYLNALYEMKKNTSNSSSR